MYRMVNPNPYGRNTGDCVIRAICIAENKTWDDVYLDLMVRGFMVKDMIETNELWATYLRDLGYTRHGIPDLCPDCYTVREFAEDNPQGTFILGTGTHAVCIKDGTIMDAWDSSDRVPLLYWTKGE